MIYSHKPQRSGRSIKANTNNPPQDPPPPPDKLIGLDDALKVPYTQVPDVSIEDSTPPVLPAIEIPTVVPVMDKVEIPEIVTPTKVKKPKVTKKVTPKIPKKITPKITPVIKTPKVKPTWKLRIVSFFKRLFRRS